jgi:hypothetical protein
MLTLTLDTGGGGGGTHAEGPLGGGEAGRSAIGAHPPACRMRGHPRPHNNSRAHIASLLFEGDGSLLDRLLEDDLKIDNTKDGHHCFLTALGGTSKYTTTASALIVCGTYVHTMGMHPQAAAHKRAMAHARLHACMRPAGSPVRRLGSSQRESLSSHGPLGASLEFLVFNSSGGSGVGHRSVDWRGSFEWQARVREQ